MILPQEVIIFQILLSIIALLSTREVLKCSLISWKWFYLINNSVTVMRNLKLSLSEQQLQKISKYHVTRDYRIININHIEIPSNFQVNFECVENLTLNYCAFDTINRFQDILLKCKNLKQLYLISPRLKKNFIVKEKQLATENADPALTIENFQCNLHLWNDRQNYCPAWQLVKVFKHLSINVRAIDLTFRFMEPIDDTGSISTMIDYLLDNYSENFKSIAVMGVDCNFLFYKINEQQHGKNNLKIKSLKICVSLWNLDLNTSVFDSFLETQTELTHFQLDSQATRNQMQIIYARLTNLTYLQLPLHSLSDTELLCENIAGFTKLQVLKLDNFDTHSCAIKLPPNLKVLNIHSFTYPTEEKEFRFLISTMENMEALILNDVYLESEELENLLQKMPNLKHIRLCDTHTSYEGLRRSLAKLLKLQCLELTGQYVHDEVLLEIRAAGLTRFNLMLDYSKEIYKVSTLQSYVSSEDNLLLFFFFCS
jgi:hypothetical protein